MFCSTVDGRNANVGTAVPSRARIWEREVSLPTECTRSGPPASAVVFPQPLFSKCNYKDRQDVPVPHEFPVHAGHPFRISHGAPDLPRLWALLHTYALIYPLSEAEKVYPVRSWALESSSWQVKICHRKPSFGSSEPHMTRYIHPTNSTDCFFLSMHLSLAALPRN